MIEHRGSSYSQAVTGACGDARARRQPLGVEALTSTLIELDAAGPEDYLRAFAAWQFVNVVLEPTSLGRDASYARQTRAENLGDGQPPGAMIRRARASSHHIANLGRRRGSLRSIVVLRPAATVPAPTTRPPLLARLVGARAWPFAPFAVRRCDGFNDRTSRLMAGGPRHVWERPDGLLSVRDNLPVHDGAERPWNRRMAPYRGSPAGSGPFGVEDPGDTDRCDPGLSTDFNGDDYAFSRDFLVDFEDVPVG